MPASTPAFVISPEIIDRTMINRPLRIDATWRYIGAMVKSHGATPPEYRDFRSGVFAANVVLKGSGTYIDAAGHRYALKPGVLFHRFPGVTHSTIIERSGEYVEAFVVIDAGTVGVLQQLGLIAPKPVLGLGVNQMILDEFLALKTKLALTESALPTAAMLLETLQFLNGLYERASQRRDDPWHEMIREACIMLEKNLHQRLRLQSVAQRLGVPYPTFRKEFRRLTGTSPGDYRIRCRVEQASILLLRHPVKHVAASLGYCDPFTFSSQFKKFTGASPKDYQVMSQKR